MPRGREEAGRGTVALAAPVPPSRIVMVASSWLTTHRSPPEVGWARVCGFRPTATSQRFVKGEAASSEATVLPSLFTTEIRARVLSTTMVLDWLGRPAVTG